MLNTNTVRWIRKITPFALVFSFESLCGASDCEYFDARYYWGSSGADRYLHALNIGDPHQSLHSDCHDCICVYPPDRTSTECQLSDCNVYDCGSNFCSESECSSSNPGDWFACQNSPNICEGGFSSRIREGA